jgi:proton-translocating NADH-quinone oxidoreductase chain L
MSEVRDYLWLVPALPLLACAVTAALGPGLLRKHSHWPCVLAGAGACVCSLMLLFHLLGTDQSPTEGLKEYYELFKVGAPGSAHSLDIGVSFRADELTAIMLVMITFVGTLIAVYSAGYMAGDPGYARFFAEVALFIFSMTLLVLGDNLILLFAGWEGVGLCSYLLIGFWFTKPSAADAARKAFLVTRIGDVGLILGLFLLWFSCGYKLDYTSIFEKAPQLRESGVLFGACFLIFCGAAGKSAQFPLHVWLPDAMEGPSPVSALIHAATMVTAGVYLVARFTPLFALAPDAQLLVACIGGFTALFAALIALTQNDLKRVLAYSTLSQLGYMFLALGCGLKSGGALVTFAVTAAIFHLFTHAFFKALLFLSAGSVMHAMGNVIDMRRFSGLRTVLPHTHWTFLCGALALAGVPPLSGFWSKDEILASALEASRVSDGYRTVYLLLFIAGVVTAALTAFYTFRAYFMTFWGELKLPPEAGSHGHDEHDPHHERPEPTQHHTPVAHESPPVMTIPLWVLAFFAVGVGLALTLLSGNSFAHFLGRMLRNDVYRFAEPVHETQWLVMGLSVLVALGGVALAYWMYVADPTLPKRVAAAVPVLYQLSLNKFFVDEIYAAFIVAPLNVLAGGSYAVDQYVIDGFVDWFGQSPTLLGRLFRPVQNGLVQFYALAMVLGLAVFLLALIRAL